MISSHVYDLIADDMFLRVAGVGGLSRFFLKVEGFNAGGSIKLKTARSIVQAAVNSGIDVTQTRFIESTSGNLGVALAVICAAKRYQLTCVLDPNANPATVAIMQALGVDVHIVQERDVNGGFLGSRIAYIQNRLANEPNLYWLNQYANPGNPAAHEHCTAPAVLSTFGKVDCLFVGVGTGGTLMGCVDYFRRESPATRIVAVDAVGSLNFGRSPSPRHIPGLGTSRRPEILDPHAPDEVVLIPEWETVRECRWLARNTGLLAGGSTGTVMAAVRRVEPEIDNDATVVAIAPDLGERYLTTVYNDEWVAAHGLERPGDLDPVGVADTAQELRGGQCDVFV
ncbi:MAG: 2,3-diaminopropionate biosynthesis protein SbnA [Micromonosporaceae bacterium]